MKYDVIIVGAGSAGAVLATRLSAAAALPRFDIVKISDSLPEPCCSVMT